MPTRIEIPDFQRAWACIKECHDSGKSDSGPMHIRLLGQSGLGKNFLLKEYRDEVRHRRNPRMAEACSVDGMTFDVDKRQ